MPKKSEPSFKDYVTAELRAAHIRARMMVKEIEAIGVALRGNVIEPVTAVEWMAEAYMLRFIQTSDPPILMTDRTRMQIDWLRKLSMKGGKGTVDKIDARALGRIADELERIGMGLDSKDEAVVP